MSVYLERYEDLDWMLVLDADTGIVDDIALCDLNEMFIYTFTYVFFFCLNPAIHKSIHAFAWSNSSMSEWISSSMSAFLRSKWRRGVISCAIALIRDDSSRAGRSTTRRDSLVCFYTSHFPRANSSSARYFFLADISRLAECLLTTFFAIK